MGHARAATIKNIVGFAHEVRIYMRDSRVIVGHILGAAAGRTEAFVLRPWGSTAHMTVRIGDISRAVMVRRMTWQRQRTIAAAQLAGVFVDSIPARVRGRRVDATIAGRSDGS
jgi:hypothetical protein